MAKKKRTNFKTKTTANAAKQKNEARSYGYLNLPENVEVYQPDEGNMYFDIVPYAISDPKHMDISEEDGIELGSEWYKKPFRIHRGIGAEGKRVVCPTTYGKPCPICEYRQKLMKEKGDQDTIDALKTSLRNLYLVFPRRHKDFDEDKFHIFEMSQYAFQKQLNIELAEDEDFGVFPSPDEGFTLKVRFEEEKIGKNTKFLRANRIDFKERKEQYDWDIVDEAPDLDKLLKVYSYSELEKMFFEVEDEPEPEEEMEDDVEESRSKSRRKKKSKDPEPEPEEEMEDEKEPDDVEDEEDEEEKPKRRSSRRRKSKDPDEEEDGEEEKPKKKSKSKSKCPSGHKFGTDFEKYPEDCEDCEVWDQCMEENDRLNEEE